MSIKQIIQESINKNPVGLREALEEELRARVQLALEAKVAESDDEEDEDDMEDDDIDNDGDVDSSDDYLKNRRKVVTRAIEKSVSEELKLKDLEAWKINAKSRGLVVRDAVHPSGQNKKYFTAKDKQGNSRGYFDVSSKEGVLADG